MNPNSYTFVPEKGTIKISADLNVRRGKPSPNGADVVSVLKAGTMVPYLGYVTNGETIGTNSKWYMDKNGDFFWSGSTAQQGLLSLGKVLKKPLDTLICTQRFGDRPEIYALPGYGGMKGHNGTDFRTRLASNQSDWKRPVYSVLGGVVSESTEGVLNGKYIRIAHDNGYESVYLHLSTLEVQKNQRVAAGARIGLSGNSGAASEAPHLHFGFRPQKYDEKNGFKGYIDPAPYFIDTIQYV